MIQNRLRNRKRNSKLQVMKVNARSQQIPSICLTGEREEDWLKGKRSRKRENSWRSEHRQTNSNIYRARGKKNQ